MKKNNKKRLNKNIRNLLMSKLNFVLSKLNLCETIEDQNNKKLQMKNFQNYKIYLFNLKNKKNNYNKKGN